jgi:intracellular multiplication protein IcmE
MKIMTTEFENENNNEFTEPETGAQEELPQKAGVTGNLIEAWRTRPLFKFIVLVIGVFAVGVAAVKFFGGDNSLEGAKLTKPPALREAPGGVVSPYMRKQTELANTERAQQAIASGGSAIPTPVGQAADISDANAGKEIDPLKELRAETELLKKQVQQTQQTQKQITQRTEPFDNSLAEQMQRQMTQLMQSWAPQGIKAFSVSKADDTKSGSQRQMGRAPKTIVSAGTVSYAQLLTEANSDVPGPVLAQIVSGPLNGARAIGAFQVQNGYDKYLVLTFTLADKKGVDYAINAIALDPDTTLGGMATEVDERYFARVILPAGAAFLQGLGSALSSGGSSVVTNGQTTIVSQAREGFHQGIYSGLSQSAQSMGQFLTAQAALTNPLVRIAAGTPMGLFFIQSVVEPPDPSSEADMNAMNGINGAYGQQGQNVNYSPYGAAPYGNNANGNNGNYSPYGATSYGNNGNYSPYGAASYGNNGGVAGSTMPYGGSGSQPYSGYTTINNTTGRGNYGTSPTYSQPSPAPAYQPSYLGQTNYGH